MPWTPLQSSGLDYTFTPSNGEMMDSSVVVASAVTGSGWSLMLGEPSGIRVTNVSYLATSDASPAGFEWTGGDIVNTSGSLSVWTPETFEAADSLLYTGSSGGETASTETYAFLIEVDYVARCDEVGPVTRANVSGYDRTSSHVARLVRGERRCLVANFNGAISPSRSIVSATWRSNQPYAVSMADARIKDREVMVNVAAQFGGPGLVKCQVTLDNGEVYNTLFRIEVRQQPWFLGEVSPPIGPYELTVTA